MVETSTADTQRYLQCLEEARHAHKEAEIGRKTAAETAYKLVGAEQSDHMIGETHAIIEYALKRGIDPRWMYQEANGVAADVCRQSGSDHPHLMTPKRAYELYRQGLQYIAHGTPLGSSSIYCPVAKKTFFEAAKVAKIEEESNEYLARLKRSIVYDWAGGNVLPLYVVYKRHWWEHY